MHTREAWTAKLDSFDGAERARALRELSVTGVAAPHAAAQVNMHLHSFFSYNARGCSPSHIAWQAHQAGFYAAGLCDFDVLDGVEEFLEAGLTLGLRVTVNLETRAYLREFAAAEINSPGEPGVIYIMGAGFTRRPAAGSPEAATLAALRAQAGQRNQDLVRRINPHMAGVTIDYAREVLPLSPGGCPTERHIVRAYVTKSGAVFPRVSDQVAFWSGMLGKPHDEVARWLAAPSAFEERVRARLVKQGGVGYEAPTARTFPPVDDFVKWVLACGAIPMATWLDGTSQGERDPLAMLKCLQSKGVVAANIVPDRNWNIADPAVKAVKTTKLREFVEAAESLELPLNIGTEMNRDGQPLVDDLEGAALRPYRDIFLRGAQIMVGHSILARYAEYGYAGAQARADFGADVAARNAFFAAVGALPPLTVAPAERLKTMGPERALQYIREAVQQGR